MGKLAKEDGDELLSTVQVAEMVGSTRWTVWRLLERNPELAIRSGDGRWYVRRRNVARVKSLLKKK